MDLFDALLEVQRGVYVPWWVVDLAGGLTEAAALMRLRWHLSQPGTVERDGQTWVARRRGDWAAELHVSGWKIDAVFNRLEELGLIQRGGPWRVDGTPLVHWRIIRETVDQTPAGANIAENPVDDPVDEPAPTLAIAKMDFAETAKSDFAVSAKSASYKKQVLETTTDTRAASANAKVEQPREPDPPDFTEFWKAYPRKEAKGAARKAWLKAVKVTGSADPIIEGAKRYANDPNRDPAYTAHPASWLNAERWDDVPQPARHAPSRSRPVSTTDTGLAMLRRRGAIS